MGFFVSQTSQAPGGAFFRFFAARTKGRPKMHSHEKKNFVEGLSSYVLSSDLCKLAGLDLNPEQVKLLVKKSKQIQWSPSDFD